MDYKHIYIEKTHSWDITPPLIWLWPDLPFPRPELECLCGCGKKLGMKKAKKYAIPGSLYFNPANLKG